MMSNIKYTIKKDHNLEGSNILCPQRDNKSSIMAFTIEDETLWGKDIYLEFETSSKVKYVTPKLVAKEGKFDMPY